MHTRERVNIPPNFLASFLDVCKRLSDKRMVAATDGNVSARLDARHILCTPSGLNKGLLSRNDLLVIRDNGTHFDGRRQMSSEIRMHLQFYLLRPEVHAVVHAHPIYATGFACAAQTITDGVFPEVIVGLGRIPIVPYATPGTDELPEVIQPFVQYDALLLQNHGAVTVGKTLREAYERMEKVEHSAQTLFVARMLGGENILSSEQVARLLSVAYSR